MKLYALPPSPNTFKITALANHLGLSMEVAPVDMMQGQNQSPEYLKKNPNGLMPTLEDGDFVLWESNAIMMYLAQKKPASGLYPADLKEQALVQQWLNWHGQHWSQALRPFMYERLVKPMFRGEAPDMAELAKAEEPFHKVAKVLEGQLVGRKYLLGDQLTIADFAVAANLIYAGPAQMPLADYPNIQAYGARVTGTEAWAKAIPAMPAGAKA